MSYLVLHIDVEFIVATICADNGTSSLITNGKEELLWLYFFNNPHQNSITYGKDNKAHFNNSEINYYGRFFDKIEKEEETFLLRGIEHPVIDLLKESGLFDNIRKNYQDKTLDKAPSIPTLLTFSLSISDNAKQKTVECLKTNGFEVKSYTIPLAELVSYHALNNRKLNVGNGSIVIFLEATNSTLHLMKLSLLDNYFLMDGNPQSREGMGFDPRKLALLRFVVNEANKSISALFSEEEKLEECKRLELKADDWLKKLDIKNSNIPYIIREVSFSKMPSSKRDILVRKSDLDSDTGAYIQKLKNVFEVYNTDNIQGDLKAVILLGNCFQSDRVKTSFEQMIGEDKVFFYSNNDIHDILSVYSKIDITRYASEEARIKERAKADSLKKAEQLKLEKEQRRKQEEEIRRRQEEEREANNMREADAFFNRAIELEINGKLEDALENIKSALRLYPKNNEYKQFISDLNDKIKKSQGKIKIYKEYLTKGDNFLQQGHFEKALEKYEAAKFVDDNPEIIKKIIEVKELIRNREKQKKTIEQLLIEANTFIVDKKLESAKSKINEIISIDSLNEEANKLLTKIDEYLRQQEEFYNDYKLSGDKYFNSSNYNDALNFYEQALSIRPDDAYCLQQIKEIRNAIQKEKENKEKCLKIMDIGDSLFQERRWVEAKEQYQKAVNLCHKNDDLQSKINQCAIEIKAQDDEFKVLLSNAIFAIKDGKLKEALSLYEKALKMRPEDENILSRINKLNFDLKFKTSILPTTTQIETSKGMEIDGNFLGTKGTKSTNRISNEEFLSGKSNKTTIRTEPDTFISKNPTKGIDDNEFLNPKK